MVGPKAQWHSVAQYLQIKPDCHRWVNDVIAQPGQEFRHVESQHDTTHIASGQRRQLPKQTSYQRAVAVADDGDD